MSDPTDPNAEPDPSLERFDLERPSVHQLPELPPDPNAVLSWVAYRPAGELGWLVSGPAHNPATWSGLGAELEALEDEDLEHLEVRYLRMTHAEVHALDEFTGW